MIDILKDALIDTVKLIPLLFISYLLMEYAENKMDLTNRKIIKNKFGIALASLLGAIPQCGFSASASGFYTAGMISLGTLVSVYLSSSDEMLPILISEGTKLTIIVKILCIKIAAGIIFGYITDFITRKRKNSEKHEIKGLCESENCHCDEKNIFFSAAVHTFNICVFIAVMNFILNLVIAYSQLESLSSTLLGKPYISEIIFPIVGLIPNCASSIFITRLYTSEVISASAMISGLLANSGVGLLVLFKQNKDLKENIKITLYMYLISVVVGFMLEFSGLTL